MSDVSGDTHPWREGGRLSVGGKKRRESRRKGQGEGDKNDVTEDRQEFTPAIRGMHPEDEPT